MDDSSGEAVDRRQVFELVARGEVTEHQVHEVRCACCGKVTRGAFPLAVSAPTQYGTGMKAFAVYANEYPLLSTERISERIYELTGHRLSEGTLYNLRADMSAALEPFVVRTRVLLAAAPVAHFDESGVRVQGKLQGAHLASTATRTAYTIHPNRGEKAMNAAGSCPRSPGWPSTTVGDPTGPCCVSTGGATSMRTAGGARSRRATLGKGHGRLPTLSRSGRPLRRRRGAAG